MSGEVVARRFPLDEARRIGEAIAATLAPACTRIEIAGSIRRRATMVKDVELVAIPSCRVDLFGEPVDEPTDLDLLVDALIEGGRLAPRLNSAGVACMGRRHKRLTAVRSGIGVDLFAVLPPAQWGAIFTIRTGPAEYSERLVTLCKRRGRKCVDGHLVELRDGSTIDTPEEEDFVRACGARWEDPWLRR